LKRERERGGDERENERERMSKLIPQNITVWTPRGNKIITFWN
jgi:hypothetical protein